MPLSEWLTSQLRAHRPPLRPADVARATGLAPSVISRILNYPAYMPRETTLKLLALYFRTDVQLLYALTYGPAGEPRPPAEGSSEKEQPTAPEPRPSARDIDYFSQFVEDAVALGRLSRRQANAILDIVLGERATFSPAEESAGTAEEPPSGARLPGRPRDRRGPFHLDVQGPPGEDDASGVVSNAGPLRPDTRSGA